MTEVSTDWVLPFRLERQLDPDAPAVERASTPIGLVRSHGDASVDPRGLVTPVAGGWSLDWWVGADDRWHLPSREVAVRQRLIDDAPVVETAMRVPTGDAIHRVFAIAEGDDELVVVEIENRSKLPFALALAVRPCNADGMAEVQRIDLDGTTVLVDGRMAMLLPKPPSRAAGSTGRDGDVAVTVFGGDAGESFPSGLRDREGRTSAAFIFPLAHTASMRVVLASRRRRVTRVPDSPTAEQVARGWRAHAERGARFEVPDERLRAGVIALRASLLALTPNRIGDDDLIGVLRALDVHGLSDTALVHELVPTIAAAAERAARAGGQVDDLLDAADVLDCAGETRAASDATRMAGASRSIEPTRLDALVASASSTWTWSDHARSAARVLSAVRDQLVLDVEGGLALCAHVPDAWLGQGIEVHDAPTRCGVLSFAIRWHGDRPALLWELVPHEGTTTCRFTAPGLDPAWSSAALSGEALLAPVAPPGHVSAVTLRRP